KPRSGEVSSAARTGKAGSLPDTKSSTAEDIATFVAKARAMSPLAAGSRGRLVFALDATMSRQPTWDLACALQADMFREAAALGLLKVPVFMFQEGHDATAERAFREIARLTGGAWCRFDPGAAAQLRELLRAAAAYAAGGREALKRLSSSGSGAAKLLGQMK